jgi:hypothetical protein
LPNLLEKFERIRSVRRAVSLYGYFREEYRKAVLNAGFAWRAPFRLRKAGAQLSVLISDRSLDPLGGGESMGLKSEKGESLLNEASGTYRRSCCYGHPLRLNRSDTGLSIRRGTAEAFLS